VIFGRWLGTTARSWGSLKSSRLGANFANFAELARAADLTGGQLTVKVCAAETLVACVLSPPYEAVTV
jgi:hypothetical protein